MRAPTFWWRADPSVNLLAPLAAIYGQVAAWRIRRQGTHLPLPVLCVGNFVVGGAGKTPAALALGRYLIARGETPFFLSRGYRSQAERAGPVRVDPARHAAGEVGDEALLLAEVAPTIVGADRLAAGRLAMAQGARLLILDDGLQNPALAKDLRLVVVDGEAGLGNGLCLPAGPLRAPLAAQMHIADALIIVGKGAAGEAVARSAEAAGLPVLAARLRIPAAAHLRGRRIFAFAGLAMPRKFFASLIEAGADVIGTRDFPDHHAYNDRDIRALQRLAQDHQALLVTTEKDFARLRHRQAMLLDPALPPPEAIAVSLQFADERALGEIVERALAAARARLIAPRVEGG